jgi:hypothetical protein
LDKGRVKQYENYVRKKVNYMKGYNKKPQVAGKAKLKYLSARRLIILVISLVNFQTMV